MEIHQPLMVGMDVPNFTLDTYNPATMRFGTVSFQELKERQKWVVLFFYPADFTFVCPTELADLAEKHEAIKKEGAELISVSADTKFVHLAWLRDEKLLENVEFLMGADPTGKVARMFGVYDEETGLALRGTFIIGPNGLLVSSEVNYYNVGRDADELLRKLQANTHLFEAPDEACPAKWKPGQKTLKPSEEMVGKVYEAMNE